jgi:hypothetical protein
MQSRLTRLLVNEHFTINEHEYIVNYAQWKSLISLKKTKKKQKKTTH